MQTTIINERDVSKVWYCLICQSRIIPFQKTVSGGILEGVIVLAGLALMLFSFLFGLILLAIGLLIGAVRSKAITKVCPSCESLRIIPSTSPRAKRSMI